MIDVVRSNRASAVRIFFNFTTTTTTTTTTAPVTDPVLLDSVNPLMFVLLGAGAQVPDTVVKAHVKTTLVNIMGLQQDRYVHGKINTYKQIK